jgi:hypothetical protein
MARIVKYVGLGEEATALTEASSKNVYLDVKDFDAGQNQQWENEGGVANSYVPDMNMMAEDASPRFNFPIGPESGIGWLLKWFLGSPTSTQQGGTAAYDHEYESDDALWTFTVFTGSEDLLEEPYPGQSGDVLGLSCQKGGMLMGSISSYGLNKAADNSLAAASFSALKSFRFRDMTFKVDTVDKSSGVQSMSMKLNQGLVKNMHTAGSAALQNRAKHTVRLITGSVEFSKYDSALRDAYNNKTAVALEFAWTGALIEDPYYYKLTITLPAAYITRYPHPVKGRNIEMHTFGFEAKSDSATEIYVNLVNTETEYPDA